MKSGRIEILLSSDSCYEKLTAEIYYDEKFVALLNQDAGIDNISIEFPGADIIEDKVIRKIKLDDFEKAIELCKKKLLETG